MSYLLDTNVLSELRRKTPDAGVSAWFAQRPSASLYLSVLTLGELRKGIDGLSDANRRMLLTDWVQTELAAFFLGRVLTIDAQVADRWGQLLASAGRPLPAIDSLLAATALVHGLRMVTRNTRDFEGLGVEVINPWTSSPAI
jgi:predicted nucleic acid-binding protein